MNRSAFIRRTLLTAAALALAFGAALPASAHEDDVTPPPVPPTLNVEPGNEPFLVGHAIGTQNYVCAPTAAGGVAFALFTPEATLSNDAGKQLITHYFSPDPADPNTNANVIASGAIQATWQDKDTSTVWGVVAKKEHASTDEKFVEKGAIAWLLVTVRHTEDGPTGGTTLSGTTFIQRLSTHGGVAPATGCTSSADLGRTAFVPYTADYFFFRPVATAQ